MLRRLTLGLLVLASGAAVAACSSNNATPTSGGVAGVGPNMQTGSLYVANTSGEAIDIYSPAPQNSASPAYAIGGSSTDLAGPQYLAFDSNKYLYVTNYNAGTNSGYVTVYETYATGNVIPFGVITPGISQPHGIATFPNAGGFAVSNTAPGGTEQSSVVIYGPFVGGTAQLSTDIAGTATTLSAPMGIAIDQTTPADVYVANQGGSDVLEFALAALPTTSPSPSPSGSPTATPSPTPSSSASPSASPSPTPTPVASNDLVPTATITYAGMRQPTGIALDGSGNIWVSDIGSKAIYEFAKGSNGASTPVATITSSLLSDPTDVKIDGSGNIDVADGGPAGGPSRILIFPKGSNGNIAASSVTVIDASPAGTLTGLALSP